MIRMPPSTTGVGLLLSTLMLVALVPSVLATPCFDYGAGGGQAPVPVEVSTPNGDLQTIAISGHHAWMVQTIYGALIAVDLSDPDQPVIVGSLDVGDEAFDVAIDGNLACVAFLNWGSVLGVRVVDISDPTNPVARGAVELQQYGVVYGLDAADGRAYVALYDGGMGVVDITDPDAPALVGSVDTPGRSLDVAVAGDHVYMAERAVAPNPAALQVVDVSDPQNPQIVGSQPTSGDAHTVTVVNGLAYVPASTALDIVDVSTPGLPVLVGSVAIPWMARNVSLDGAIAYVSANQSGLQIVDVSDPASPAIVGSFDTGGYSHAAFPYLDRVVVSDFRLLILPEHCPVATAVTPERPRDTALRAYPNPFNPRTTFVFRTPAQSVVHLGVYDVRGRRVRALVSESMSTGEHRVEWNGRDASGAKVASGNYVARLTVAGQSRSTRVTVLE